MSQYTKRERGNYTLPGQEGKGFQQIPNEIWREFLRFQGSRHELQVFGAIFELTVNWKHEWQRIANKTLGSKTRISPNKIYEATGSLVRRKMIRQNTVYAEDSRGRTQRFNEFAINPKVSEWDVSPKPGRPQPGQPRQRTHPRFDAVSTPDLMRYGSPKPGEHPRNSLQKYKLNMSGMTPGRASFSDSLKRKHPPDDKEKAEFLRILGEFYKEHPHDDIDPDEANYLYDSLARRYPDVDLIFVLQKKLSVWREKTLKCFNPGRKGRALWQGPRRLLYDAFAKADDRIRESEEMKNPGIGEKHG